VGEHENHREGAVEEGRKGFVRDVEILQSAVQDAFRAEDGFPCVAADEITDPEGDNHKLIEEFFAGTGVKREEVGERVAKQKRKKSDRSGDAERAEENDGIERIGKEFCILVEIPAMKDDAVLGQPEGMGKHEAVRDKKKKDDPGERREGDRKFVEAGIHGGRANSH
jgi:hypothetical protein